MPGYSDGGQRAGISGEGGEWIRLRGEGGGGEGGGGLHPQNRALSSGGVRAHGGGAYSMDEVKDRIRGWTIANIF